MTAAREGEEEEEDRGGTGGGDGEGGRHSVRASRARALRDAKRRCCITLSGRIDERPCNEFISQITVFRL